MIAPCNACNVPPVLLKTIVAGVAEAMFIFPANAAIVPLLVMLEETRFRLLPACITAVEPALVMEPPAVAVRLPLLDIVPALTIVLIALRFRLRFEEIDPPEATFMLAALIVALVTAGLVENTFNDPASVKLPERFSPVDARSRTVTP